MSKRQAYFLNVEHAMRNRRRPVGAGGDEPGQRRVVPRVKPEAGAGALVLDLPTFDDDTPETRLNAPAKIEMVEPQDAIKAIHDLRDVASRLAARGHLHSDAMVKVSKGLEAITERINAQDAALEKIRKRSPLITGDAEVDLRNVAFRLKPPKRIDRAYFNLMSLSPEELGYAAMLDARGAVLTPHMAAWARNRALNDATKAVIYEAQAINDLIVIADAFLSRDPDSEYATMSRSRRIRTLKIWQDWSRVTEGLRDVAMDTATAAEGTEWVPTILSSQLHELIYAELALSNFFEWATMPSKVWDHPVEGADAIAYLMAEGLIDPDTNKPLASLPATRKMTLTAQKMAARTIVSWELEEDSIISMVPYVMQRLARAMARGREQAVINGQKTSTIDTADVPASSDVRMAWDGLRWKQKNVGSGLEVDMATPSAEALAQMKGVLKEYGQIPEDGVWVTGYSGFIRLLTLYDKTSGGVPFVLTQEKVGPATTFSRGQLGIMFGSPIVVSQFIREDLNASGIYDNVTTTKTAILYANRRAWQGGERRALTIRRSDDLKMETDQILLMGTWRGDFKPVNYPGTQRYVALGKNMASF